MFIEICLIGRISHPKAGGVLSIPVGLLCNCAVSPQGMAPVPALDHKNQHSTQNVTDNRQNSAYFSVFRIFAVHFPPTHATTLTQSRLQFCLDPNSTPPIVHKKFIIEPLVNLPVI